MNEQRIRLIGMIRRGFMLILFLVVFIVLAAAILSSHSLTDAPIMIGARIVICFAIGIILATLLVSLLQKPSRNERRLAIKKALLELEKEFGCKICQDIPIEIESKADGILSWISKRIAAIERDLGFSIVVDMWSLTFQKSRDESTEECLAKRQLELLNFLFDCVKIHSSYLLSR